MTPAGLLTLLLALPAVDPVAKPDGPPKAPGLDGLKLRSVGPALMSGRVVGFAVDPRDRDHFFAAAAAGGVWKTTNGGSTWTPVFDDQGSYSIGCVVLDPHDPSVVWVGSGENNSQRSVGYGDGVYKSTNGGKTWENVGLKASEHVGKIVIDPRNSDTVYVAAQGPLWASGGDRGLYKTTDGGRTWKKILEISENTGVTDLVMDPRNPDLLIAAAYQRRRHVWDAHQRRTGKRPVPLDRRGQDVDEIEDGVAERRTRAYRAGVGAERSRRRVCHDRGGRQEGGRLPLGRPRSDLGEAERVRRPGAVLFPPGRRSA